MRRWEDGTDFDEQQHAKCRTTLGLRFCGEVSIKINIKMVRRNPEVKKMEQNEFKIPLY